MVLCWCGRPSVVRTSWTDLNPGRRYYACPNPESSCKFIGFYDPPMCPRSKSIIPGLLRRLNRQEEQLEKMRAASRINNHEVELGELRHAAKWLKIYLLMTWVVFGGILFWKQ